DLLRPVRADYIEGLEVVVDVDAEARPGLALVLGRHVGGVARQVADMAEAGLDHVARAKVARNRLRLRGRLDDHQPLSLGLRHRTLTLFFDLICVSRPRLPKGRTLPCRRLSNGTRP